jgi:hypothetical protein
MPKVTIIDLLKFSFFLDEERDEVANIRDQTLKKETFNSRQLFWYQIWGSRGSEYEDYGHLGCDVVRFGR